MSRPGTGRTRLQGMTGPDPGSGESFGNFEVVSRLAAGGMAEVLLAKQRSLGGFERLVCLKRILPHLGEQIDFLKMFMDEARIAANLVHPNIAQIYDIGSHQGIYYIAMEYVRGEDVRRCYNQEASRGRTIPRQMAALMVMGAASGLDYAHRQVSLAGTPLGIVHRDIGPQNIVISFDGHAKIIDFGVAKAQGKINETRAGVLKGKYAYMSPEQASGDPVDARTDIFALGITLYETTTGVRLFKRDNELETLHAVIACNVTPPSQIVANYDRDFEKIVLRALAYDPEHRYATAGELELELERYLLGHGYPTSASHLAAYMQDLFADKLAGEALASGPAWQHNSDGFSSAVAVDGPDPTRIDAPRAKPPPTPSQQVPIAPPPEDSPDITRADSPHRPENNDDGTAADGASAPGQVGTSAATSTPADDSGEWPSTADLLEQTHSTRPFGRPQSWADGEATLVAATQPAAASGLFAGPGAAQTPVVMPHDSAALEAAGEAGVSGPLDVASARVIDAVSAGARLAQRANAAARPGHARARSWAMAAAMVIVTSLLGLTVWRPHIPWPGAAVVRELETVASAPHETLPAPATDLWPPASIADPSLGLGPIVPDALGNHGLLSVFAPVPMAVFLGRTNLGTTPLVDVAVEPGHLRLKLVNRADGGVARRHVWMSPRARAAVAFPQAHMRLAVTARPWAWLQYGDHPASETPATLELIEGDYAIILECPDGRRRTEAVHVEGGQDAYLGLDCTQSHR